MNIDFVIITRRYTIFICYKHMTGREFDAEYDLILLFFSGIKQLELKESTQGKYIKNT